MAVGSAMQICNQMSAYRQKVRAVVVRPVRGAAAVLSSLYVKCILRKLLCIARERRERREWRPP